MNVAIPKHILVTGAAGAIAGAIAKQLAQKYPHAKLSLVDKNLQGVREAAAQWPGRAVAAQWDLSQVETLDAKWAEAVQHAGPVDLLVNCAGIMEIRNFASTSWELGERMLNINLVSPLKLMRLAVGGMLERRHGCVINVASMAGVVPIKGCTYYGATKSGIAMASEIAHHELLPKGVHILTVYPGPVRSNLESGARAQVTQGFVSRQIPTGNATDLATRIAAALERKSVRVVYPDIYRLAYQFLGVSQWFTARVSPEPIEVEALRS